MSRCMFVVNRLSLTSESTFKVRGKDRSEKWAAECLAMKPDTPPRGQAACQLTGMLFRKSTKIDSPEWCARVFQFSSMVGSGEYSMSGFS